MPAAAAEQEREETTTTQVCDLPEVCLSQVIALTSPRDAARCSAVSPSFRAAADSDHVWQTFLPFHPTTTTTPDLLLPPPPTSTKTTKKKKDAYLDLCDTGALLLIDDDGGEGVIKVWLEKPTGARCYALSARRLSLPWDDGEFTWRWTTARSRFAEVAELVDCTCLEIYAHLPASLLTPGTPYAAFLVYGTTAAAEGGGDHRGLSYPDQETTVAVGGRVVARHRVCLRPDDDAARKFWDVAAGAAAAAAMAAGEVEEVTRKKREEVRMPRVREDGWWEMEMGTVVVSGDGDGDGDEEVVASFEVLGWYPKRGLIVEAIEFRPLRC